MSRRTRRKGENEDWPRGVREIEVGGTYCDRRGTSFSFVKAVTPTNGRTLLAGVGEGRSLFRYFNRDGSPADGCSPLPLWWFSAKGPNVLQEKALKRAGLFQELRGKVAVERRKAA